MQSIIKFARTPYTFVVTTNDRPNLFQVPIRQRVTAAFVMFFRTDHLLNLNAAHNRFVPSEQHAEACQCCPDTRVHCPLGN